LTTLVDNIEHIESTTVNGTAVVKIFLQPTASVDRANAQVTAASQTILRQLPPGTLPPLIVNYTASSVPILQLSLSGPGLSEALRSSGDPLRRIVIAVQLPSWSRESMR
jgi:multidrug efflux pump subunit AcrB